MANSSSNKEYLKNAFLSLIFLLTFREAYLPADLKFCPPKSKEYQLAEQVLNKYRKHPVHLNFFEKKSLNECFEELLKGNGSQEVVRRIIEAD